VTATPSFSSADAATRPARDVPGARTAFAPGLASVTFRRLRPTAVVGLARQVGLVGIEWSDAHAPAGLTAPDPEASPGLIAATARATGLDCAAYAPALAAPGDGPERFAAALAVATRLGARHMRIWPGTRGRAAADYGRGELRAAARAIAGFAATAAAQGIRLALECHSGTLADGAEAAERLVERISSDRVDLVWRPRPGLGLDEALGEVARIGRLVTHVRVSATDERARRLPLAARANWWRTVLAALQAERRLGDRWAFLEFVRDDDTRAFAEDALCLVDLVRDVG
jgi:hypothetical protein